MEEYYWSVLFFIIAFFYASVGFGGGSSYLAILSLILVDFFEIRSIALVLNVVVVSVGTISAIRNNLFQWRLFWPFIFFSIPAAFLGATITFSVAIFFILLGVVLLLSGFFMVMQSVIKSTKNQEISPLYKGFLGGSVGFLSGLVGIGGGIFLSPTLNLLNWKNPRIVAALASVFILFNSMAGIISLLIKGHFFINWYNTLPIFFAVTLGGVAGNYFSSSIFNTQVIRVLTAILVFYVGIKLIVKYGFGFSI